MKRKGIKYHPCKILTGKTYDARVFYQIQTQLPYKKELCEYQQKKHEDNELFMQSYSENMARLEALNAKLISLRG